jgi:hypothetical protein
MGLNIIKVSMILAGMSNNMPKKKEKKSKGIEVRIAPNADEATKAKVMQLADLFQGPLFAKMVRDAVEDMIIEGKLAYDLETDEFDVPEDIVMNWAVKMEKEVWSKKKRQ